MLVSFVVNAFVCNSFLSPTFTCLLSTFDRLDNNSFVIELSTFTIAVILPRLAEFELIYFVSGFSFFIA